MGSGRGLRWGNDGFREGGRQLDHVCRQNDRVAIKLLRHNKLNTQSPGRISRLEVKRRVKLVKAVGGGEYAEARTQLAYILRGFG